LSPRIAADKKIHRLSRKFSVCESAPRPEAPISSRRRKALRSFSAAVVVAAAFSLLFTLQGGAASAKSPSRCGHNGWSLEAVPWRSHGKIVIAVGITTNEIHRCVLRGVARVAVVERESEVPVPLRGSPARWRISKTLEPWSEIVHVWTWRNWCQPKHLFSIEASLNGQHDLWNITGQPLCRDRHTKSGLVDSGSGTRSIPFTGTPIPAHILSADVPPPISPALVRNPTGWLVSDGRTLVAVYAGEAGEDPAVGRFVIIRQNLVFGFQTRRVVDAGRVGTLQITAAPTGAAVETSAQHGDIEFSSKSGATGVLHLANNTVELTG
jgi:hypothetical protein